MFRVHSEFETLKASDIVTVFHGTDATQCKEFLRRGVDGTVVHYRTHNQGHERGIYITPSIRTALDFGNYILEIRVRAKDLYPTARWGLGSQRKHMKSSTLLEPYAKSFRPMVSYQLNERVEPQAMFIGFVPVKDIVSVHYARPGSTDIEKLSLDEARTRLSLNPKYDIDYSLDMSAEDVLDALAVAHNMTVLEITGILNNYDLDAFCDEFRIPRKLKLRLAMYMKHMRKGTAMSINALSSKLTTAGVKHVIVHGADTKQPGFKPDWTATETKLLALLKDAGKDGLALEDVRIQLAGRAWMDLKKIPKPVDQAIENLIRGNFISKKKRNGTWCLTVSEALT
jgi:hypothetical protein